MSTAEELADALRKTPPGPLGSMQPKPLPESVSIPQRPVQSADLDTDSASPLSLVESHARLSLHATKLGQAVKEAKARADEATVLYRRLRDELDELERGLRALNRVTHPRRRTK